MFRIYPNVFQQKPYSLARIHGSKKYPRIYGTASFFDAGDGTLVIAEIFNLPSENNIYAMHIHNGNACTGNEEDLFKDAGTHLDFTNSPHPFHTGDLPALFSNNGYVWSAVYTDRFSPGDVIGYPVIIHLNADDYHTQPSGNSGEKIACGIININY